MRRTPTLAAIALTCGALQACTTMPKTSPTATPQAEITPKPPKPKLPYPLEAGPGSPGRTQIGKASYYGRRFSGRRMADGRRYSPHGIAAASKTLPIGTVAKVTNLETNDSAIVQVEDRGPHVPGRIIDVSSRIAQELRMKRDGVIEVAVQPIAVPHPNGAVTLGAGARELPADVVAAAVLRIEELAPLLD